MYYSEEDAQRLGSGKNLQNLRNRIATDEIITRTMKRLRDIAMGIAEEEEAAAEQEGSSEELETLEPAEAVLENETSETVPAEETESQPAESAEDEAVPADEQEEA